MNPEKRKKESGYRVVNFRREAWEKLEAVALAGGHENVAALLHTVFGLPKKRPGQPRKERS